MRSLFVLILCSLSIPLHAADKPNVILVFIDDMGWADFSCFGNTEAGTPNIDKLAAEGIAFEQFYVNSPICSPSRVAISTGQYPSRWDITSYLANRQQNAKRGIANWLDLKAPFLPRLLNDAGYATGHFGKWHMGGQRDVHEAPLITEYGFDESITNFEGLGPRVLPLKFHPDWKQPRQHNLGSHTLGHGPVIWHNRAYVTEKFVEAATVFLKFAASQDRPFYLNLWPDDVHAPMHPPLEFWGDGGKRHLYLQVLETMDRQLGALFDAVRNDPQLRDNTLILVCSDNGPEVDLGSAGRLKGNKATLYEGGIRSSLVVWAPGLMPKEVQGIRNKTSVFSAIDLVPSLLQITGTQPPDDVEFDGENLAGTLLGKGQKSRQAPLFFRRPPDRKSFRHYKNLPDLAVRSGDWKLYCDYDGGNPRLFHLQHDPSEEVDVADDHRETVQSLTSQLVDWNKSMRQRASPGRNSKLRWLPWRASIRASTLPVWYDGGMPSVVRRTIDILPNALTMLRLLAGLAYPLVPVDWRIPILIYAAVSDLIDGPLSRFSNSTSNFGQVWDPIADKVCVLAVLLMTVVDGQIAWWELLLIGARDVMVIGLGIATLIIDRSKLKDMPPRISGKIATAGQFAFLVGVLVFATKPAWLFVLAVGLSVWSGIDYTVYGIRRGLRETSRK